MKHHELLRRIELIGVCKWRDREHASQLSAFILGLEAPFLRLSHEWAMHLAAAETQAREWYYALKEHSLEMPEEDQEEYAAFELRMYHQSVEFTRQLELMKEHSAAIRHSRTYRAFIAHILQDARLLTAALQPMTRNLPATDANPPLALRREPGGGWSLQR